MLQDVGLFPHLTVRDNIAVVPRLLGWDEGAHRRAGRQSCSPWSACRPQISRRDGPSSLSGGQRQRVGVARALAADPPILLMDEPFGALDPVTRSELHDEFRRIQAAVRKTIVIVTHDMGEAMSLASRIGVLADGVLVALAPPAEIAASRDPRVRGCSRHSSKRRRRSEGSLTRERAAVLGVAPRRAGGAPDAAPVPGRPYRRSSRWLPACPLGILAARRPRVGAPLVWLVNAAQTIPSLAMFGFLLPLPFIGGLGARVAITVLIIYALLPIMRTTVAGIKSVDPALVEAGTALGMTPRQLLRQVQLPLALPSIVAGIRVAAVIGVGTATIAAAVGAGGLGEYIFRGLSMVDPTVILAGAIPSAVLALTLDGALTLAERAVRARLSGQGSRQRWLPRHGCRCGRRRGVMDRLSPASDPARRSASARRTSPSRSCSASCSRRQSRRRASAVDRRLNLGGTFICDRAIRSGDIDVYVEYTGTASTAIFHQPVDTDPQRVLEAVRRQYAAAGLTLLDPLGFENTFAILVRGEDAKALGLETIGDAAPHSPTGRPGSATSSCSAPTAIPGSRRPTACRFGRRRGRWTCRSSTARSPIARSISSPATRRAG